MDGDRVIPIPRLVDVDDYLDFITNRAAPDLTAKIQWAMEALWSIRATMGTDETADHLTYVACGIDLPLPVPTDHQIKICCATFYQSDAESLVIASEQCRIEQSRMEHPIPWPNAHTS